LRSTGAGITTDDKENDLVDLSLDIERYSNRRGGGEVSEGAVVSIGDKNMGPE